MSEGDASAGTPACYLHPDRPALLRCSRCERPICADDAIEAPVGYQCRECAKGGRPVRHLSDLMPGAQVTKALVAIIAVIFIATQVDQQAVLSRFGLIPAVVSQEWWLTITSGFLHIGIVHVAFNGILLWRLGEMLEPVLGHGRFGALYAAGLAGGSFGVVLLSWATVTTPLGNVPVLATNPFGVTVGASGAVFGLMGAAMAGLRNRGVNPWRTDIGGLVLLNLVITFAIPGISVGGHVGGLLTGLAAGKLLFVERDRARAAAVVVAGLALGLLVVTVVLANATVGALGG